MAIGHAGRWRVSSTVGPRFTEWGGRGMCRLAARLMVGILGGALLLASLGPAMSGPALSAGMRTLAAQGAATPVRIGTLGIIADAPFYIAVDRGYFAQLGLAPTLERFDTAAQMVAPLAAGQLDA